MQPQQPLSEQIVKRTKVFYFILSAVMVVFVARLFYLQVLRHEYYSQEALSSQLKQFEIPADRGSIYAYDGGEVVPLVLNETRYRIVADPQIIRGVDETANALHAVLTDVPAQEIADKLRRTDSRYEIIANKQLKNIKDAVDELALPGIFTHEKVPLRVYVHGDIAAQTLGFVNDAGEGNYGIEQFYDSELTGVAGRVKALTDQNNVPLLATGDNIQTDPVDGQDIVLTLDVSMQSQAEAILRSGLEHAQSESGSAIILEAQTGAVKAMASWPSYSPDAYTEVEDAALYDNAAVRAPLEPGSVMKVLTAAAAVDSGSVAPNQSYFDPGFFRADDATITNVSGGAGNRTVSDILRLSLNTGATWLLMQMGGGELNEQGRLVWHDYLTEHYRFGQLTGIEQGSDSEAPGVVPDPVEGFGLNIKYANTAFGQGITVTPIQMAAAVASVVNGGTYYQPTLVRGTLDSDGSLAEKAPAVVQTDVVSPGTAQSVRDYMENVVQANNRPAARDGYRVGGKTGTAEIADRENGGYFEDRFNGTYVGFVGGDTPEYVVFVRVNEPKIPGYAGSQAAQPVFSSLSNMLIDNFAVQRIGE